MVAAVTSIVRPAQFGSDVLHRCLFAWRSSNWWRLGRDKHQFQQAVQFLAVNLDATLSLATALVIIDGRRLTANHERARIRLGQPVVQRRRTDAESASGVL